MKNKNLILALVLMTALSFTLPQACFASLGAKLDGGVQQAIKTINFTGPDSLTKTNGALNIPVVDSTLLAAGAANGGATSMLSSTTVVPTGFAYVNMAVTTTDPLFSAKTLADGKKGQFLTIHVYNGSQTTTLTPATSYGFSALSFNAVDDQVILLWVGSDGWTVWEATSVTVTP